MITASGTVYLVVMEYRYQEARSDILGAYQDKEYAEAQAKLHNDLELADLRYKYPGQFDRLPDHRYYVEEVPLYG